MAEIGSEPGAYPQELRKRVDLPWFIRLSVPKNTSIANPAVFSLELPRGEVERLWIETPKGCAGLVGIQIWRYSWQLFPRPGSEWYVSDNSTVSFRFREILDDQPFNVAIRAYNLDAIEDHHPWLAFEMVRLQTESLGKLAALLDFMGRT